MGSGGIGKPGIFVPPNSLSTSSHEDAWSDLVTLALTAAVSWSIPCCPSYLTSLISQWSFHLEKDQQGTFTNNISQHRLTELWAKHITAPVSRFSIGYLCGFRFKQKLQNPKMRWVSLKWFLPFIPEQNLGQIKFYPQRGGKVLEQVWIWSFDCHF